MRRRMVERKTRGERRNGDPVNLLLKYTRTYVVLEYVQYTLVYPSIKVQYMSQETVQNPWIHRVGNSQFFHSIVEDVCGIAKGCPRNRQRVSADL